MRFTIVFNKYVRHADAPFGEPVRETKTFNDFHKLIEYSREKHIRNHTEDYYVRREPSQIMLRDGVVLNWSDFQTTPSQH